MALQTVALSNPPDRMTGYLAVPAGEGPWPGVIVVHDILGPTTDLRRQVEWLAAEGFVALAPDLYWRGARTRCMFETIRAVQKGEGRAFDDLTVARRRLRERDDCTGTVGVVGFCMGGSIALALAASGDVDAANANYGTVSTPDDWSGACPLLATFGGRDRALGDVPDELETALTAAGVEHEIITYPEAGHGFLNDHAPSDTPLWFKGSSRLLVVEYDPVASADARPRITDFLHRHLDGAAAG